MYIIVGLGNPGDKYKHTRHNIGFDALDKIAKDNGIAINEKKFKAEYGKGLIAGQKVILAKPQTYMNLSGESVREVIDFYKVDPSSELIVISDDIDLDVGQLRVRPKGSAGGHNGLKNIELHLATRNYKRLKIGISNEFDLPYITDETETRKLFVESSAGHDMAVMEGVMGFYDGVAGTTVKASAYDLADTTDTPVILIVSVPAPFILAPMALRKFATSTI